MGVDERVFGPIRITTGVGPEANDYKFFHTLLDADAYAVQVMFPNGDDIEVIPFPVHIGETDTRPLLFGAVAILGLSVVIVAIVKRRRNGGRGTRTGKKNSRRPRARGHRAADDHSSREQALS